MHNISSYTRNSNRLTTLYSWQRKLPSLKMWYSLKYHHLNEQHHIWGSDTRARRQGKHLQQHLIQLHHAVLWSRRWALSNDQSAGRTVVLCLSDPSCPAWHCSLHMAVWLTRCLGKHTWRPSWVAACFVCGRLYTHTPTHANTEMTSSFLCR